MWPPAVSALLVAGAACSGRTINLGQVMPPPFHFGAPVVVQNLAGTGHRDNPSLTADLLEIYFTTNEDPAGNGDVWSAKRASIADPFENAAPIAEVNSADRETSSAISADGLTLWFGSDRPGGAGGLDVWVSRRASRTAAWPAPANVQALNTSADDIPRPPGQHQLVMPMASTKNTATNFADRNYQTYLANRSDPDASFQSPLTIPEIDTTDRPVVDGSLTDDGLAIFFASVRGFASTEDAGPGIDAGAMDAEMMVAFRRSTEEPFVYSMPLGDLNSTGNDRDPWISPDGTVFYFTSDREGATYIYEARVLPRSRRRARARRPWPSAMHRPKKKNMPTTGAPNHLYRPLDSCADRLGRRASADELGLERSGQPGLKLFVAPPAAADQHVVVDGIVQDPYDVGRGGLLEAGA
jgi:WD40-like Beta Propeller Repeat